MLCPAFSHERHIKIENEPVPEPMSEERRAHVRRLLQVDAFVTAEGLEQRWRAQIIDIARMATGFITAEELPERPRYRLQFRFPGSDIQDEVEMTLVYCHTVGTQGRFHYGARILAVSQECVDRIVEYVTRGNPRMK